MKNWLDRRWCGFKRWAWIELGWDIDKVYGDYKS
jgi:hypothetical protein